MKLIARLAFVAETRKLQPGDGQQGYRQWAVLDGRGLREAEGISNVPGGLLFSPDSRRFVYGAVNAGRIQVGGRWAERARRGRRV